MGEAAVAAADVPSAATQAWPECGRRADFVVPSFTPAPVAVDAASANPTLTVTNATPDPIMIYRVASPSVPADVMGALSHGGSASYDEPSSLWFITDTNDNILFVPEFEECYVIMGNSDEEVKII